jgi:hypothetical protein
MKEPWALVQTGGWRAMMKRCNGSSRSRICSKGRHFDRQIIILCVSWYTSFKLSLRDLVIMMANRGISVTHTTILRWVQRYLPEFEKRWRRYARSVGGSLENGRDLYKGSRTLGVPVLGGRQSRQDRGFLPQLEPGRKRRQILSPQRDEEHSRAHQDHLGRLCGLAPRGREMKADGELPDRVKVRSSHYLNNLVSKTIGA